MIAGFDMVNLNGEAVKTSKNEGIENLSGMSMLENIGLPGYGAYAVWGRLFKRESVMGIRFPKGVAMAEDGIFMVHAYAAARRVVYIGGVFFHVTLHSGNMQWQGFNRETEYGAVKAYEDITDFYFKKVRLRECRIRAFKMFYGARLRMLRRLERRGTDLSKEEHGQFFKTTAESLGKDTRKMLSAGSAKEKLTALAVCFMPGIYIAAYRFVYEKMPWILKSQQYM